MSKTLPQLTAAGALADADLILVGQTAGPRRSTLGVLKTYAATGGGAVSTVFGRSGTVVATSGDYPASKITNDSSVAGATVKAALEGISAASAADTHGIIFPGAIMTAAMRSAVIADGASHPMSGFYGNLTAARADFPLCNDITNEACFEVMKAAVQAAYNQGRVVSGETFSGGTIMIYGDYLCNAPIRLWLEYVHLVGLGPYGHRARLRSSDATGTIDANSCIIDFGMYDEFHADLDTPNRGHNGVQDPQLVCDHIEFCGLNGPLSSSDQSAGHGYVSGVRVRQASMCQFRDCRFIGSLYDGIVFTAPQLFTNIEHCWISAARDGVANWRGTPGNNSTTQWIRHNEFIGCGRYGLLLDYGGGAVQAKPIVYHNSFEGPSSTSFYYGHPEWFVHGVNVIGGACFINVENLLFDANRFEGWDSVPNAYGEVHLVNCQGARITENNINTGVFISTHRADQNATAAFSAYYNGAGAHNYCDITDQRAYIISSTAHPGINTEAMLFDHNNNGHYPGTIYYPDGLGGAATIPNSVRDQGLIVFGVPTKDGTYARVATPADAAAPTLLAGIGLQNLSNVGVLRPSGCLQAVSSDPGLATCVYGLGQMGYGAWQASTVMSPFASGGLFGLFRRPTIRNGFFFQVTAVASDAKTGSSEPLWVTGIGNITIDHNVTWTCVGIEALDADVNLSEIAIFGKRQRSGSAAPTTGTWAVGDKLINSAPSAGGTDHWVCTTAGTPGTWKAVAIAA